MPDPTVDIRDFIKAVGPSGARETALFIGYFLDVVLERGSFSTADVKRGFTDARLKSPKNVSDTVTKLATAGLIIRLDGRQYALAQAGLQRVADRLNEVGWFASVAPERTDIVREISQKLHQDVLTIADQGERDFIEEALACLHPAVNAYRAAVIMGWSATVHNLRKKVVAKGLQAFNEEFQRRFARSKKLARHPDDLEDFRDGELLAVCEGVGIISKSVKNQLDPLLTLRNGCAHPTGVKPEIHRVKAFFEDIIKYVLSVPPQP